MILLSGHKVEHIRDPRKEGIFSGKTRSYAAIESCRLRRGEHSGISSEDVATSEGSFGRTSEGHRPVELIRNQTLDDFPA